MTSRLHGCSRQWRGGRLWLGMILASALGFSGCQNLAPHDEGLRRYNLSATACQARSNESPGRDNGSKPADDPWMSEEAQEVCRHLQ